MVKQTQIKVSEELKSALDSQKQFDNETYEEVIWDFLEERLPLSDETKKNIEISRKEFKERKVTPIEELMKEYSLSL
jgi:6-pyruvoyl-tetrahydropterin synthase